MHRKAVGLGGIVVAWHSRSSSSFPRARAGATIQATPPPLLSPASTQSAIVPTRTPAPLPSLLPLSLNPHNTAVDLICSRLRQQQPTSPCPCPPLLTPQEESLLLPYLDISRVLLRSQSLPLPSLRFFTWAASHPALRPSPFDYALLSHILARSRLLFHAARTLSHLVTRHHPHHDIFACLLSAADHAPSHRDHTIFSLLVKVFARAGHLDHALDACRRALRIGFALNARAFNALLHSLVESNRFDECWDIFDRMRSAGVAPNTHTFNILTHALCRGGDPRRAGEFLEEMELQGFDPDVTTYNTLIHGFCRQDRLDDAFHLYRIMPMRGGVEPDLLSHTALMKALCTAGRTAEAHRVFDRMLQRGLCPDKFAYDTLIYGYCREGRMRESRSLLLEMIQFELMPDEFTCKVLLKGFIKSGKLHSCLNVVVLLRKLGVVIPFISYKSLIAALCTEKRPNAARSLLNWMSQDNHKPNIEIHNMVLDALCNCDFVKEALELKDEMVCQDVRLDLGTYRVLISCLCRLGRSVEGECLMTEMVASGLLPDSIICAALVGGHCEAGNFMKAESLLMYFAEKFQIYDNKSYNALLRVCCEERDMTKPFVLQDRMMKLGFVPNSETCKYLIYGLSKDRSCGKLAVS